MHENMGAFIVQIIQTAVFLAPLLVLFYRQGKKDQVLEEAVRDMNGLGKKVSEIRSDGESSLSAVKGQMENIERTLIQLQVTMEFVSKAVEELKERSKG